MAHLALALMGPLHATLDGVAPIQGLNSAHLRALLAYLAVERGREHSREALAALLWADRPDREALGALRNATSNLRAALGDRRMAQPILLVTRSTIQLNPAGDCWLDVAEFEQLIAASGDTSSAADPQLSVISRLQSAAALYRGPFLHGLSLAHSPGFEEWVLLKGEEYQRAVLSALGQLTSLRLARRETTEAARWARRQIELEPYRESAHRQLMAALALGGARAAALAHYQACRRLLADELGCEPDDETQALYAQIRDSGLALRSPRPQASPDVLSAAEPAPPAADGRGVPGLVAREEELARLSSLLDRALANRGGVALIAGEAGSGKTALLDEFARQACQAHGDLIVLRGSCNALSGAGDPYLPFREILQTLAGDVKGKRAGETPSQEQVRRIWAALPAVAVALVEHGPDLIDSFVPGAALMRHAEAFPTPSLPKRTGPAGAARPSRLPSEQGWQARLRESVRCAGDRMASTATPQADLLGQVTGVLHTVSARCPLLLTVDDVQWADGGTAALLFHLGRRLTGSRILLICAYRPEALRDPGEPEGLGRPLESVLHELTRKWGDIVIDLDRADGRGFVEALVDSEPNCLRAAFRQALYDHTGGNPLFTVELLRTFQERGYLTRDEKGRWVDGRKLPWEALPPRVEAVIAERMSRLPPEGRRLLEAASVEGTSFSAEVAAGVLGIEPWLAHRWLSGPLSMESRLVQGLGVQSLPAEGRRLSRYRFAHGLFQEYLYNHLDPVDRAHLHGEVGAALADLCRGDEVALAQSGPQLALHFEEAGRVLEAVRYHLEAGRWAARLVANEEAIAHLERGLALLQGTAASGPGPERLRLELRLGMALVAPVMLQQGWQAPAGKRTLERLADLIQHPELRDDPQRLTALTVLALSAGWSADPERSDRVGRQLLNLARSEASGEAGEGDRQSLMLGHWALGLSHWLRGQPVPAREHLSRAVALYDPAPNRPLGGLVAADPGVMARSMLGAVLWQLGYPDQARACLRQAVVQGHELDQPSSLAFAHFVAMLITSVLGRDWAGALSHCRDLRPLGQPGLVYGVWEQLLAAMEKPQAGAGIEEPAPAQGVDRAVEAQSTWQAAGSGAGYAALLCLQSELCARAGQVEMGLEALERARTWIDGTGVRALEAEVSRMRGELLLLTETPDRAEAGAQRLHLARSRVDEAEACFRHAFAVAREQGSRWWELRAAASLVRLRQQQGEAFAAELAEARQCLSEVVGRFTEGFALPDLQEAAALIGE
ncbi:MAG TPA: BTAD domain-containing putative transcriptional regulator [Anaerolineae bacterium]|nr:BTAD domain-containing putative transcriptional regulator [Anaerolineae bacterium]